MEEHITLNGMDSTLIKGLLISSLPPITKPAQRTNIEEIDGRDGDIVTKLGYSAYDKKMTIGLFGDFNIDDIIQYFDSEGTVIFSNEPDKFYRYQILNQIDFDKLLRFRTATVVFHVQPFKFSSVDDKLIFNKSQVSLSDPNYSETQNGVTLSKTYMEMLLEGTATESTIEFYVPIKLLTLKDGHRYTLSNQVSGYQSAGQYVEMRIIKDTPTDANTAGGSAVDLEQTRYLTWTQSGDMTLNYLYVKTSGLREFPLVFMPEIVDNSNSIEIINRGNVISRPKITLYGEGDVALNNDITVNIDADYITLDGETLNAYKDNVLKNRKVTGDLKNLVFAIGKNELSWNGAVYEVIVENYSRWI